MDIYSTEPIEEIDDITFKNINLNKEIEVSPHALDHLSKKQRKVFKENDLTNMLRKEKPRKIYLQKNGRYSLYYRKSDGYRKLILEMEDKKIVIVTFTDPPEIPKHRI